MLFESRLGLTIGIYCKSMAITNKSKKRNTTDMLRKEKIWNHIKCSIKTTKDRKRVKRNKEQRQQIENRHKYVRY